MTNTPELDPAGQRRTTKPDGLLVAETRRPLRINGMKAAEAERRRLVEGKMSGQEAEAYLSALERESVEMADREVELRLAQAPPLGALDAARSMARAAIKALREEGEQEVAEADPMPVFTIKAQDNLALETIARYRGLCEGHELWEQAREVEKASDEIADWRERHPEAMKMPDHKHVPAAPLPSGLEGEGS